MPTTPYAKALVSVNGGATTSGGVTVPSAATIQFSPESTVGWGSPLWQIYSYPAGWTAPAGWSTDASGVIFSTANTPPAFTLPASSTPQWGKFAARLTVTIAGQTSTLANGLVDENTILSMLSPKGQHDFCFNETQQFGGAREQWVSEFRATLRAIEANLGGSAHITDNGTTIAFSLPITFGTNVASVGTERFDNATAVTGVWFRNVLNTLDFPVWSTDTTSNLWIGSTSAYGAGQQAGIVSVFGGTSVNIGAATTTGIIVSTASVVIGLPLLGNSAPYALNGFFTKALATASYDLAAAEYSNATIQVTGTGANTIRFPPGTDQAAYTKYVWNLGASTLAVKDTSNNAPAALLASGMGALFLFRTGQVKQLTAAFSVA